MLKLETFFDNINSGENIYNFFVTQQDAMKKLLKIEFDFSDDYDDFITNILPSIKDLNDNKFDILTNKNSKFLFYNFHSYLNLQNETRQLIRHSQISDDTYTLNASQNKYWPCFIDRIIEFSQCDQKLPIVTISDRAEADIIFQTKENY